MGAWGSIAGFAGGWLNMLIMRVTDVFYAFPSVLLAVAISGALGAGIVNAILSLTLVFIPPMIRVAESVTTGVRAPGLRGGGAGHRRRAWLAVVRVHVLPNVLGPIFVYATSLISVSMILASGLSFLGLGTRPPQPEWGLMLNTLRTAIYSQPLRRDAAGRVHLRHLRLLQPGQRRPPLGHGRPVLRTHGPGKPRPGKPRQGQGTVGISVCGLA